MVKRLKEILEELDGDIYWKSCNYINDIDEFEIPSFYSRDMCKNITFEELLLWYLSRLGQWQDKPVCFENECEFNCEKCNHLRNMDNCEIFRLDQKVKQRHFDLFMELINIYTYYKSSDCEKYNSLKNKLRDILD